MAKTHSFAVTEPSPGVMQTWIRAAADISTSRYRELATPAQREQCEYGLYLLADRQLFQTAPNAGPGSARRGVYAGFSVEDSPTYFNRFAQYYEGRVYGFGLIPGRPNDLLSFVVSRSQFSGQAVQAARKGELLAHDGVTKLYDILRHPSAARCHRERRPGLH